MSLLKNLYVVTVVSNPYRYKTRFDLHNQFREHMEESGAKLYVAELAYGDRPFEVTSSSNPRDIQFRSGHTLWHKENLLNLAIQRLPPDWEHCLWLDSDIHFLRKDWLLEAWHALQHHDFVQCFSQAIDLGPQLETIQVHHGFVWCYKTGQPFQSKYGPFWHPGYAWGATRTAIDKLGGLLDVGALGASDHHMALSLINKAKWSLPGQVHPNYAKAIYQWESKAEEYIKRNIGYVPGTILHYWHGKKKDRKYIERWDILTKNQFDPETDIVKDSQGVYQLTDKKILLRDQIAQYFSQRNEDSIDVE